jgi:hypothetical protein
MEFSLGTWSLDVGWTDRNERGFSNQKGSTKAWTNGRKTLATMIVLPA